MSGIVSYKSNSARTYADMTGYNFMKGLNTNAKVSGSVETQLSKMINFTITPHGYLKPRPGLSLIENLNTWVDFDEVILYDILYSNFYYENSVDNDFRIDTLSNEISQAGVYALSSSVENYSYLVVYVNNEPYYLSQYIQSESYIVGRGDNISRVTFTTSGDFIQITSITGTIDYIQGVKTPDTESLTKRYSGNSLSEICIYHKDGVSYIISRFKQLNSSENVTTYEPSEPKVLYNEILKFNEIYILKSSYFLINTKGGVYQSEVFSNNGQITNRFIDGTSEVSTIDSSVDIIATSVYGYNILSVGGDINILDKQGVVINIDGIQATGVDIDNKIKPFKTGKNILLKACITYTNTVPLETLRYQWSYTYIGLDYSVVSNVRTNVGDVFINSDFSVDNKETIFVPIASGVYRFYVTMLKEDDEIPDYITRKTSYVPPNQTALLDIEFSTRLDQEPDGLLMHDAIKNGYVVSKKNNYYIYVGAENSLYSNTLFLSLPNNPMYVPTSFIYQIPDEKIIDIGSYRQDTYIYTNKNIYKFSGDAPDSIISQASSASGMKAFYLEKVIDKVVLSAAKNIVNTIDGMYILSNSNIKKVWFDSRNVINTKTISSVVNNILPEEFSSFYYYENYIFMIQGKNILVREILEYNEITGDGRFMMFTFEDDVAHLYGSSKGLGCVTKNGKICYFNDNNLGVDFGNNIPLVFRTTPNFLLNPDLIKKFYGANAVIMKVTNDDYYLGRVAVDVSVDGTTLLSSYKETVIDNTEGRFLEITKEANMDINSRQFVLYEKPNNNLTNSILKDGYGIENSKVYDEDGLIDYVSAIPMKIMVGHGIEVEMEFEAPFIIKELNYDYKNKKISADKKGRLK